MGRKSRSSTASKNSSSTSTGSQHQHHETATASPAAVHETPDAVTMREWFLLQGPAWVLACMALGCLFGFVVGAGLFGTLPKTSDLAVRRSSWRQTLANRIRSSEAFLLITFNHVIWEDFYIRFEYWVAELTRDIEADEYAKNPSHPRVFAVLREAIVREQGGYVHPGLGFLVPAPSGAARGIGMLRNGYHKCQIECLPGLASEKYSEQLKQAKATAAGEVYVPNMPYKPIYHQEDVLIRVPLSFQMTRSVALDKLQTLIPGDIQKKAGLHELDDAALLVMLLANERGVGRTSRFLPYIASLPTQPSCGYARELRPYMLDAIHAYHEELEVDVQGWSAELLKATDYADRIAEALNWDFGGFLNHPPGVKALDNIKWALCQVASRATAGSEKHGSLRLIPLLDLINHDANAGPFMELSGKEKIVKKDFLDATETDSGTFVLRSRRHGRRRPLRAGQELLVNYNVPHYSPLDWLVALGFVPPERWGPWEKVDPVLPRVRTDGPFGESTKPTTEQWKERNPLIMELLRSIE